MKTLTKKHFEIATLLNYAIGAAIIAMPFILAMYCAQIINLAKF